MGILGLTLGDWRTARCGPSGLLQGLGHESTPGIYLLSARCCGSKGVIPGARHSWFSIFSRDEWATIELTDEETLTLQADGGGARATWTAPGTPSAATGLA